MSAMLSFEIDFETFQLLREVVLPAGCFKEVSASYYERRFLKEVMDVEIQWRNPPRDRGLIQLTDRDLDQIFDCIKWKEAGHSHIVNVLYVSLIYVRLISYCTKKEKRNINQEESKTFLFCQIVPSWRLMISTTCLYCTNNLQLHR